MSAPTSDAVRGARNETVASRAIEGLPPPTRAELDAHAIEVGVFEEAELIRCQRWADELNARVSRLGRATRTPVSS